MKTIRVRLLLLLLLGALFAGCVSIPKGATPVKPFEVDRYLGTWYEIARMDFRFEKHLDNVTAQYTQKENGTIGVRNRGHDTTTGKWKQSVGKAKQLRNRDEGRLKVSFFGPFYSGYNVIAIDKRYRYALVAGDNLKYMWILSRTTELPEDVRKDYLDRAYRIGYDTTKLVWTHHTSTGPQDR